MDLFVVDKIILSAVLALTWDKICLLALGGMILVYGFFGSKEKKRIKK
ncbi:MAG: hypothetical protein Q8936_01280 [Bacillota bacterium]|nr:hypothetical protein [Bacillota bacterium]